MHADDAPTHHMDGSFSTMQHYKGPKKTSLLTKDNIENDKSNEDKPSSKEKY